MHDSLRQSGVTLIELIMVIVLMGVVSVALIPVLTSTIDTYKVTQARSDLVARGRLALERIAREVREAVPNTVETVTDAGGNPGIQFLVARSGGRFVELTDNFGAAFTDNSRRFERGISKTQLYVLDTALTLQAGDQLIIGNTAPADIKAGNTVVALASIVPTTIAADGTNQAQILGYASHAFPNDSPARHFVLTNTTHEVGIVGNALHWRTAGGLTGYDNDGDWGAGDPMLIDNITGITFSYAPGTAVTNAVLRIDLTLTDSTESIRLYREIQIRNTP